MLFLFLFLFGLALGTESPSGERPLKLQRGNCPPFWLNFNSHCYKYVSTPKTWADAELYCVSEKANLVSIHSQEEQDFVKTLISNFANDEGITWIGLSDTQKEGAWMWSDGGTVDYVFWDSEQPDNYKGIEDCVHLRQWEHRKWNDIPCSHTYPSVCAFRTVCP